MSGQKQRDDFEDDYDPVERFGSELVEAALRGKPIGTIIHHPTKREWIMKRKDPK